MYSLYSDRALPLPGFPIRTPPDQSLFNGSPRLFAVYRVLHRLSLPRHPPYALNSLTIKNQIKSINIQFQTKTHEHFIRFRYLNLLSTMQLSKNCLVRATGWSPLQIIGGGERVRTDDPLRARQVLSQLSYTPKS